MSNRYFLLLGLMAWMSMDLNIQAQSNAVAGSAKLTIFEIFTRTSCGNCKTAAAVIRGMIKEYAGQPVLFLDQPADRSLGNRYQRWQKKYNRSDSASLPFFMVDSGRQIGTGTMSFKSAFHNMVDEAMLRSAPAALQAETQRVGNSFRVFMKLTYNGSDTLTYLENQVALQILVYEEAEAFSAGYPVRAQVSTEIYLDIRPGDSIPFILETPDLEKLLVKQYKQQKGKIPWERLRVTALADYLPQGSAGAYDILAAARAPIKSTDTDKN